MAGRRNGKTTNARPLPLIGFCGAGGTGKTTTAKALCAATGLPFIPSRSRVVFERWELQKEEDQYRLTVHDQMTLQRDIFQARLGLEASPEFTHGVADRTLADQLAYTMLRGSPNIEQAYFDRHFDEVCASLQRYTRIFYFPLVSYPTIDDGMRETIWGPRFVFDSILREILRRCPKPANVWTVPEVSVDQRVELLRKYMEI